MIGSRCGLAAFALASLLAIGAAGSAYAAADPADPTSGASEAPPTGPADVAIPFHDTASIEPQTPWRVADCAAVRAASELVTACDAESIVLEAGQFDPDAGVIVLPVELTSGARTVTVRYRLTLEAPPAPGVRAVTARAVASGALLRVPLSEFSLTCTVCADGGSTRIVAVDPVEAGSAWTTPTHVVFRASRDYRGPVEVHVAVADDFGTASQSGIAAEVYPARDQLVALDVVVPVDDDGGAEIDLAALTAARSGAEVFVVGCGAAVHGAVTCADGVARYSGRQTPDQFAFRTVSGGEQTWGSVTLVAAGDDETLLPRPGDGQVVTVPAARLDGDEPVAMAIIPPAPPEGAGTTGGGVFTAFSAVLDRVGAR